MQINTNTKENLIHITCPKNPFFIIKAYSSHEKNHCLKAGLNVPRAQEFLLLTSACFLCVWGTDDTSFLGTAVSIRPSM